MDLTPDEREQFKDYNERILALSRALSRIGLTAKEAGEKISRLSKSGLTWEPITKTLYKQ